MKIIYQTLLLLIIILQTLNAAPSKSRFDQVHFELPKNWQQKPTSYKTIQYFTHNESIATLSITIRSNDQQVTANKLKENRSKSHYDSWINIYERTGTTQENLNANVKDSHIAVFVNQRLDNHLIIKEQIIGEYYYTNRDYYYIVSINTTKKNWQMVQTDLRNFLDSFWIGEKKHTYKDPEEDITTEWIKTGITNKNNNYIDANIDVTKPLKTRWKYKLEPSTQELTTTILANNKLFILEKNKLTSLDTAGNMIWNYNITDTFKPFLSYKSGELFLIKEFPNKEILCIVEDSGQVLYKIPYKNEISSLIIVNNKLVYVEESRLKIALQTTGEIIETNALNINMNIPLVTAGNNIIVITKQDKLISFNTDTHKKNWTYQKKINIKYPPITHKDHIYIVHTQNDTDTLTKIDVNTGKKIWSYAQPIMNLEIQNTPVINNDIIVIDTIITAQTLTGTKTKNNLLIALDIDSKKNVWDYTVSAIKQRPIITTNILFFNTNNDYNTITLLDTLTGKQIPLKRELDNIKDQNINDFKLYKDSLSTLIKSNQETYLYWEN